MIARQKWGLNEFCYDGFSLGKMKDSMLLEQIQPDGEQRRWYEQDQGFTRLLLMIQRMPQEQMQIISIRLLLNNCRHINKQIQDMMGTHGIDMPDGADRLTPHQHRRAYDRNPKLRQLYDAFYHVPIQGMTAVGFNLTDTLELLLTYSMSCHQMKTQPQPREILNMMRVGLHEGLRTAHTNLSDYIGPDLYKELGGTGTS